jgi:hypothetical protein
MLEWLLAAGLGPAAIAVPVNWGADALASTARRWFKRVRRTDDLSRLVRAATGTAVELTDGEFDAVRRLLEDPQTWRLIGSGPDGQLAARVAECLPPRPGRTTKDSRAAAVTIARGLLEFAAADLNPALFQQVLLARLDRMETGQASALDQALFGLHADLGARFDAAGEQLERVLDRLPPGPAGLGEVTVYLTRLIGWLNADPWPHSRQLGGPVLTPAAIERKLQVSAGELRLDADDAAARYRRLVILGGPGSGKTWLAKRAARRAAEHALDALREGATLEEVELPLFTTCSRLFAASGTIRHAAISSALDQLADLGGERLTEAVRAFFNDRNAPTVLVVDSLDEAHGPPERLRQLGTLPWRIVLTSRPSPWDEQLAINARNKLECVAELQALRYPDDVEPFVRRWFSAEPKRAGRLVAQIAHRPHLQRVATVPLILAFYCILGGGQDPLRESRRELYDQVINRMLSGRWRSGQLVTPNAARCRGWLRQLAWSAAACDPRSGIGTWADVITADPAGLGQTDDDAVDHIAPPVGPPDLDTGQIPRRFIHRSIREHLVAVHISGLPVAAAVEAVLPHIWFDPDWEYTAPTAIAMHPQQDELLRTLLCRAAGSDQIPADLAVIDAGSQVRTLLARVAAESSRTDWSGEIAHAIERARLDLARSEETSDIGADATWLDSNRQILDLLLERLDEEDTPYDPWNLVEGMVQLYPTSQDKARARAALLRLLAAPGGWMPSVVLGGLVRLDPTEHDKDQIRGMVFAAPGEWLDEWIGALDELARLHSTPEERAVFRDLLVSRLIESYNRVGAKRTEEDEEPWEEAEVMAKALIRLADTAEDRAQARDVILGLSTDERGMWWFRTQLDGLVRLAQTTEETAYTRGALLSLLARQASGWHAEMLTDALLRLNPTVDDKAQARDMLLGLLAHHDEDYQGDLLRSGLAKLDATAQDHEPQASYPDSRESAELARTADPSHPVTRDDIERAREIVANRLTHETDRSDALDLVYELLELADTAADKAQTRTILLSLLAERASAAVAVELLDGLIDLAQSPEDNAQIRAAILSTLDSQPYASVASGMLDKLVELDPTAEDLARARGIILGLLAERSDTVDGRYLEVGLAKLNPTSTDLSAWPAEAHPLSDDLLAAVRQNSSIEEWLAALSFR